MKAKELASLSDLRQWHATQVVYFRSMEHMHNEFGASCSAKKYHVSKTYLDRAKDYKQQADFHLKAIQMLNDVCAGDVVWPGDQEVTSD